MYFFIHCPLFSSENNIKNSSILKRKKLESLSLLGILIIIYYNLIILNNLQSANVTIHVDVIISLFINTSYRSWSLQVPQEIHQ